MLVAGLKYRWPMARKDPTWTGRSALWVRQYFEKFRSRGSQSLEKQHEQELLNFIIDHMLAINPRQRIKADACEQAAKSMLDKFLASRGKLPDGDSPSSTSKCNEVPGDNGLPHKAGSPNNVVAPASEASTIRTVAPKTSPVTIACANNTSLEDIVPSIDIGESAAQPSSPDEQATTLKGRFRTDSRVSHTDTQTTPQGRSSTGEPRRDKRSR
jgi:serine/threonine protein kinase